MHYKIDFDEIENILGFELDTTSISDLKEYDLQYDNLLKWEYEKYLIHFVDVLLADITKSGEHRINEWEHGWSENLEKFKNTKDINDLVPRYHSKHEYVRWNGKMVVPKNKDFDYKLHILLVDAVLRRFLLAHDNIFEFGCGPAYHLLRLRKYFPDKNLYGADWTTASQQIIENINNELASNIKGFNFDFFNPDYNVDIPDNSAIYTVAALEQVGSNFKKFIDYLLVKKPALCVHFEPIDELLDKNKLLDNLTIKYFRKRKYLDGFLPYLEELERQERIIIINKKRLYSGSYFIEGHSLIVWKPI